MQLPATGARGRRWAQKIAFCPQGGDHWREMKTLTIYTYSNCDTCRSAIRWLRAQGVAFVEKPIREIPPTPAELRAMLRYQGGAMRKLFNVSGRDYRALGLGEKLATMGEAEALALLAANGNLVKRPFAIGADCGLVGFDETVWARELLRAAG
jgi:arsenate reductase